MQVQDEEVYYTTVKHDTRKEYSLSVVEYCIADSIEKLSRNPKYDFTCKASKKHLASFIGVTRRTVINAINKLEELGFIERVNNGNDLRPTSKWYDNFVAESRENNSQGCEKSSQRGVKKVHGGREKSSHNNNSNNNRDNNRDSEGTHQKYEIPTQGDVESYFKEQGEIMEEDIPLEAQKFINHYEDMDWRKNKGKGKRIDNWHRQAGTWAANYKQFNRNRIDQKQRTTQMSYHQEI